MNNTLDTPADRTQMFYSTCIVSGCFHLVPKTRALQKFKHWFKIFFMRQIFSSYSIPFLPLQDMQLVRSTTLHIAQHSLITCTYSSYLNLPTY